MTPMTIPWALLTTHWPYWVAAGLVVLAVRAMRRTVEKLAADLDRKS